MSASASFTLMATWFFVTTNSLENISDNGWRPMSNEKVAELRNFIKNPRNVGFSAHPDILERREIKIPNESKQSTKEYGVIFPYWREESKKNTDFDFIHKTAPNILELQSDLYPKQIVRKAKKIDDTYSQSNKNAIDEEDIKKLNNAELNIKSESNNYEVIENVRDDEKKEVEEIESTVGYVYEKPKAEAKEMNHLTKNLFSILANYNIRTSDKLPNYALSLRQNSRNSDQDFIYMQVPIKLPLRYNSPEHLPLDSLLAVFLSNYGYYLPGLYGFQRNYNNLYGYLASNNIHNNKPFGSYKIFSDTDSFHKY
ncbi:unnamed protein product, partial [Brenthis ino]